MTSEGSLVAWEQALEATERMLDAARRGDWDGLVELERDRAKIVARLQASVESQTPTVRERQRAIIQAMLAREEEIRVLSQDWMRELREILSSVNNSQRLGKTYSTS